MLSRRLRVAALAVAAALGAAALTVAGAAAPAPVASALPPFTISTVVSGLHHPWDLTWVGSTMLYTQRAGTVHAKVGSGAPQRVTLTGQPPVYASGEGGLLGIVADPAAASNRRFYTCQVTNTGTPDVRVLRYRLLSASSATLEGTVVAGMPVTTGRHSGCRLRFGTDGKLYVGTGDAAQGTNAQNRQSLGGKVLRVNWDGSIPNDNPFVAQGGNARYVWTYGHRNIQGLALRPGTGQLWSVEHGSYRDDEINLITRGGNYGWDPVPGYNETVPMTDTTKFPNAVRARWSSGDPTIAPSGAAFVNGMRWGSWQGMLAMAVLKDQGIRIMHLSPDGRLVGSEVVPGSLAYGRVRTVQQGPDGALWFTTSNGGGGDVIGRIAPTATAPKVLSGRNISTVGVAAVRTGNHIYAFVRSSGGRICYRRSIDDGRTWAGWVCPGLTSPSAPAVTSSAPGRVDLFLRSPNGNTTHTPFVNGVRGATTNLGGVTAVAPGASSSGPGVLDVFVTAAQGGRGFRNHYQNGRWSGFRSIDGLFSSSLSASVDRSTGSTTVTGRGQGTTVYQKTVTAASNAGSWIANAAVSPSWSARALGDLWPSRYRVGVSLGPDGAAIVDRSSIVMAVPGVRFDSAPAVVTRPDGTFVIFGRVPGGGIRAYDARPGAYRLVDLGGIVL